MYEEVKARYCSIMNGQTICRSVEDMTPLERQFYENMVNEVVYSNPLTLTNHAIKQSKARNLSVAKIRYIYFEGALSEIQFDDTGVKAILSYSTNRQSKKGFSSNIVLDLLTGKVVSTWNRQYACDMNKDSHTYKGYKNYVLHSHQNTLELFDKFTQAECLQEPSKLVQFLRKYQPRFDEKQENKINSFLQGRTLLSQL